MEFNYIYSLSHSFRGDCIDDSLKFDFSPFSISGTFCYGPYGHHGRRCHFFGPGLNGLHGHDGHPGLHSFGIFSFGPGPHSNDLHDNHEQHDRHGHDGHHGRRCHSFGTNPYENNDQHDNHSHEGHHGLRRFHSLNLGLHGPHGHHGHYLKNINMEILNNSSKLQLM